MMASSTKKKLFIVIDSDENCGIITEAKNEEDAMETYINHVSDTFENVECIYVVGVDNCVRFVPKVSFIREQKKGT